ncbi:FAD-binding protein [Ursidibacter maritimus]|uniref:L-aspartate oxidase n=1 Tax=Ursidibacter maritimus TaxID=1331689 RepID=A0A949T3S8_9PAST|nr:FAD-binding protein [Ursidibacter maritimus]KAE9539287.1 fumarate reductase [Ursidibacter maritimus]MBV6524164.1 FAD-binding protein [Ursidibacter maritimus]MBV6525804.1 FAD-binding protein [Ursidibacter maritimus]MBV6526846.1 FAD-binding protein [Ursidibacter maritimus]MBV6529952.1 FAD-binding protein [Ursidibacter maritimus]
MYPISISHHIETDLLIVGTGIAGLASCVEANAKQIRTVLISKAPIGSGASYFPLKATLGIQVTGDKDDQAKFKEDIDRVAQGMNNPKIVQAYIEDSAQAVELLERIGFRPWKRNDNRPACFAKYARPIYLINQWKEAAERAKQIIEQQQTEYYENATLLHIVVKPNESQQNVVQGAIFCHKTSGEMQYIFCKTSQIILATGGIAGLYKDNLYPADVIGSSHYIAQQAGAKLTNLEFIQFIPSFVEPKYKVLFGEHTLKYVTKVTDSQGNDLFAHLLPEDFKQMMRDRSDYAPFSVDFNCVEFDLVMMKHLLENPQEKGVYLHYSADLYQDQEEFYTVYLNWLNNEVGIHLLRDKVAIAPFAHSCNGGIVIDDYAESDVKGLFAVGEVSSCIEGANRLGGNSVGGSLVFAKRAIKRILQNLAQNSPLTTTFSAQDWENYLATLVNPQGDESLSASQLLSTIRELMARFANVYRTTENLTALLDSLKMLEQRYQPLAFHQHQGIEIYYALKTAQAVVNAMLQRETSLGSHFRLKENESFA